VGIQRLPVDQQPPDLKPAPAARRRRYRGHPGAGNAGAGNHNTPPARRARAFVTGQVPPAAASPAPARPAAPASGPAPARSTPAGSRENLPAARGLRSLIYAERRNGGHPRAHKAALTRPLPSPRADLKDTNQRQGQGQRQGPAPIGGGVPHPRNPIIGTVLGLSNERRFDSPSTAKAKPAPPARTPPAATGGNHGPPRRPTRPRPPRPAAHRP
jgi:hypothetical protein